MNYSYTPYTETENRILDGVAFWDSVLRFFMLAKKTLANRIFLCSSICL